MSWQIELKNCINTIEELEEFVDISRDEKRTLKNVVSKHPMRASRYYLSLVDENNQKDPIRKMALPSIVETSTQGSFDTSGEHSNTILPGLQHKYNQTALILATSECVTYYRHCFRKRLVGLQSQEVVQDLEAVVDYIQRHNEINNVLISGGDPLTLPTDRIEEYLEALSEIPHLDFIRFGTRTPVTYPDRILKDTKLLDILQRYSTTKKMVYIVTQYNHPREITKKSRKAIEQLLGARVPVSNQTVLLKGVNDKADVLAKLQNKLVGIGVIPYYVFQCRPVKRVKKQFQVPLYDGYHIVEEAKRKLNGHSKRFRYIMSHETGKIEIAGIIGGLHERFVFKYHQAKNPLDIGRVFTEPEDKEATWLDDLRS